MEGYVYFLKQEESGEMKIGWSGNPAEWRQDLFECGSGGELTLVRKIPGMMRHERTLHRKFRKYRVKKKKRREWFKSEPVERWLDTEAPPTFIRKEKTEISYYDITNWASSGNEEFFTDPTKVEVVMGTDQIAKNLHQNAEMDITLFMSLGIEL